MFLKISGSEEVYGQERGEYQDILSKNFCITVPKRFVGEPFSVSIFPGIRKFYASTCYVTNFYGNIFCLTDEKFEWGNLLSCVSEDFR